MIKGLLAQCCHGGAWLTLGAFGLGMVAAARLIALQVAPPSYLPTAALATAVDDQKLLEEIGADVVVGIVTAPGWLAATTTRGAEVRELAEVLASVGYGALRHQAPSVRVLTAFHLLSRHPERAGRLAQLMADEGEVIQVVYEDPARAVTVRDLVIDMLCAVAPKAPAAARFLRRAGDDSRRLAARAKIHACLDGLAGIEAPESRAQASGAAWLRAAQGMEAAAAIVGFNFDASWFAELELPKGARDFRARMLDAVAVPVSRTASWLRALAHDLSRKDFEGRDERVDSLSSSSI